MAQGVTVTLMSNDPCYVLPGTSDGILAELAADVAGHYRGLDFDGVDATREVERDLTGRPLRTTLRIRFGGVGWIAVVRFSAEFDGMAEMNAVRAGVEAVITGRPSSGAVDLTPEDVEAARAAIVNAKGAIPDVAIIDGVLYSTAPLAESIVGVAPSRTFWNGEPCQARRVRVVVGKAQRPTLWYAGLEGQERSAVEVTYGGATFYLDDEPWRVGDEPWRVGDEQIVGAGWLKVTVGQGSPDWGHRSLPDDSRVVGERP